jgi:hypothetical protein
LEIDGRTQEQPFVLRADPRSAWTPADLTARHAYLSRLFDDVSAIDVVLNAIDSQKSALRARHDATAAARRAQLDDARRMLTADDEHDEDSIAKPDRIRERILAAAGALGGSLQPPSAAHLANAQAVQRDFEQALAAAKGVVDR